MRERDASNNIETGNRGGGASNRKGASNNSDARNNRDSSNSRSNASNSMILISMDFLNSLSFCNIWFLSKYSLQFANRYSFASKKKKMFALQ